MSKTKATNVTTRHSTVLEDSRAVEVGVTIRVECDCGSELSITTSERMVECRDCNKGWMMSL